MAVGAALARFPFYSCERLYVAHKRRRHPPSKPPIFILGHWRSGTTHLYNIMSKAEFGYVPPLAAGLPWDLLGLASLLKPLLEKTLPSDRFIDKIPVLPDSPQEDEVAIANMCPLSFYHGLYFPKRFTEFFERGVFLDGCTAQQIRDWQKTFTYFLDKLSIHHAGRQILVKNPVYTARVRMLHSMFPDAKFIHIYRNPINVFPSMRNFYHRLFEELALQPYDHVPIDDVILGTYPRMMDALLRDQEKLPATQFVELSYEDLRRDPVGQVERIYGELELAGFSTYRERFEAYVDGVRGYRTNRYTTSADVAETVRRHWGPFLKRWGYEEPSPESPGPAETASAAGSGS